MKYQTVLRKTFLFRSIAENDYPTALEILSPSIQTFARGATLAHAGDKADSLVFITSGTASVFRDSDHRVLLNRLSTGACYGAAALFSENAVQPTEIVAKTALECAVISETALKSLFLHFPSSALDYISFLSDRIRFLNRRVQDFSCGSTEKKTAQLLLSASDENGAAAIPNLRVAAESMNIGRASLYRILTSFSDRGIIERNGKEIRIIKPTDLKGILS